MSDKSWKRFEREVAAYFKTERNPLSGSMSKHDTGSDTLHSSLYIECKRDKSMFTVGLTKVLEEAKKNARKEKKVPIVALKQHNKEGFWILIHSNDFKG